MDTQSQPLPVLGDLLLSRDGAERGEIRGGKRCNLTGCRGWRYAVRWPKGNLTWPCSKGLEVTSEGVWKIA